MHALLQRTKFVLIPAAFIAAMSILSFTFAASAHADSMSGNDWNGGHQDYSYQDYGKDGHDGKDGKDGHGYQSDYDRHDSNRDCDRAHGWDARWNGDWDNSQWGWSDCENDSYAWQNQNWNCGDQNSDWDDNSDWDGYSGKSGDDSHDWDGDSSGGGQYISVSVNAISVN